MQRVSEHLVKISLDELYCTSSESDLYSNSILNIDICNHAFEVNGISCVCVIVKIAHSHCIYKKMKYMYKKVLEI